MKKKEAPLGDDDFWKGISAAGLKNLWAKEGAVWDKIARK